MKELMASSEDLLTNVMNGQKANAQVGGNIPILSISHRKVVGVIALATAFSQMELAPQVVVGFPQVALNILHT